MEESLKGEKRGLRNRDPFFVSLGGEKVVMVEERGGRGWRKDGGGGGGGGEDREEGETKM